MRKEFGDLDSIPTNPSFNGNGLAHTEICCLDRGISVRLVLKSSYDGQCLGIPAVLDEPVQRVARIGRREEERG